MQQMIKILIVSTVVGFVSVAGASAEVHPGTMHHGGDWVDAFVGSFSLVDLATHAEPEVIPSGPAQTF